MAREIKRLYERWDSREIDKIIRKNKAWTDEFAWWRRAGFNAATLRRILKGFRAERIMHEEKLRDRLTQASTRRQIENAVRDAAPLIQFLKTEKEKVWFGNRDGEPFFGDLGERVEYAVRNYIDTRLSRLAPRNRPGELWLVKCVNLLAVQLMSGPFLVRHPGSPARSRRWVRQSEKSTICAIEHLLKLAGHGEVVTQEKIRHIIRTIRPLIHERRNENDRSDPIGTAEHRSRRHRVHRGITQATAPNKSQRRLKPTPRF